MLDRQSECKVLSSVPFPSENTVSMSRQARELWLFTLDDVYLLFLVKAQKISNKQIMYIAKPLIVILFYCLHPFLDLYSAVDCSQ